MHKGWNAIYCEGSFQNTATLAVRGRIRRAGGEGKKKARVQRGGEAHQCGEALHTLTCQNRGTELARMVGGVNKKLHLPYQRLWVIAFFQSCNKEGAMQHLLTEKCKEYRKPPKESHLFLLQMAIGAQEDKKI